MDARKRKGKSTVSRSFVGSKSTRGSRRTGTETQSKSSVPRILVGDVDLTPVSFHVGMHADGRRGGGMGSAASVLAVESGDRMQMSSSEQSFSLSVSHRMNASRGVISEKSDSDTESEKNTTNGSLETPGAIEHDKLFPEQGDGNKAEESGKHVEVNLDEVVLVELRETDTITLLHMPGLCVWTEDTLIHQSVTEQNAQYKKLVEERGAKDIYSSSSTQTFNLPVKDKDVSANPAILKDVGVNASTWDIYDSYVLDNDLNQSSATAVATQSTNTGNHSVAIGGEDILDDDVQSVASNEESSRSQAGQSSSGYARHSVEVTQHDPAKRNDLLLRSGAFAQACKVIERAIRQNELQLEQILYRGNSFKASMFFLFIF